MVIVVLVGVLVVVAAVAAAAAVVATRAARKPSGPDHDALLELTREALAAERTQTVQAAVDTLLAVAGQKFADQQSAVSRELDLRNEVIGTEVRQVSSELARVQQLVADLQRERAEQHGRLEQGLTEAVRASTSLAQTTQSLREALASTQARGQWGERMAEDVLRSAGFVEGINYRRQATLAGGGRPDFTFELPRERVLHMDVKFPLDNYQRALEASSDAERQRHEAAFLKDVRARIKEISGRGYIDPEHTVEAVLLFIPNESIYGFVHERDPQLADVALAQKVVLCSPFTLFAVLAVVRQAVDAFQLQRTSDEILQCLGGFSDQWGRFSEALDKVGKTLERTQSAYDDLTGPRKRQLQRQLDRIDSLRAQRGLPVVDDEGSLAELDDPSSAVDDHEDGNAHRWSVAADGTVPSAGPARDEPPRLRPVRLK